MRTNFRFFVTAFILFITASFTRAQTYPYADGFEGLPSGQVPAGWGGSMKVLTYHGMNQKKAISARVNSAVLVDSAITPLIGPLTEASYLTFFYRIIDYNFYPDGNATNLVPGDQIEVMLSTDGVNYQTVYLIDENNHNTSFLFMQKKVYITQWQGSNAYIKFRCQFASGNAFYVDFDTVQVRNDPAIGINELNNEPQVSVYPNPVHHQSAICSWQGLSSKAELKVFNVLGNLIYHEKPSAVNCQLPTANWLPGIYFIEVADGQKKITRKLLIQ